MKASVMLCLVLRVMLLAAASLASGAASAQSGLDQPQPFAAYLNGIFPANTPGSAPAGSWSTQNAFSSLTFPEPVRIVEHPRANKLVVVSKTGPLWIFDNSSLTTTKQLLLDLTLKTNYPNVGEGGVTGFAFHPDFGNLSSPNRGYIYIAYRYTPGQIGISSSAVPGFNRISRFTVSDSSGIADINSELILINQYDRQQWHIGGSLFFGNDSFLYIGVGDEGNAFNRQDSTQRLNGGLWSGILRIDVNNDPSRSTPINRQPRDASQINSASDSQVNPRSSTWPATFTQGYSIPLDNPFRDMNFIPGQSVESASLGEFYAIGMRHPWTISQDPVTGYIWYADVGEDQREEIGRVVKGGNHQWGFKEGFNYPGPISQPSPLIGISTPSILDYTHAVGKAVIGAGVYRGPIFPELQGKYIFSDFNNGQLWAIAAAENGPITINSNTNLPTGVEFIMQLPAGFSAGINSYCLLRDGNILLAKTAGGALDGGTILKVVRQGVATPQPPTLLSQTGAFQSLTTLTPIPSFIPYSLIMPFWSDNALKTRWLAVPNDGTHDTTAEKISITPEGDWNFPLGTVMIKHFEMALDQRNLSLKKKLETRFLIHGNDGWYGVTYRWNAAGTDATLLDDTQLEILQITDSLGATTPQVWTYPSRTQCLTCHTPTAGGTLGTMTRQFNKDQLYPTTGRTANQLITLSSLGFFQTPINSNDLPNILTLKAVTDTTATLSQLARSYLDSNCAYCHQPGGVRANFDVRYTTTLNDSQILYGPLVDSLGIVGEAVVVPGDSSRSIMYQRANSANEAHSMPPVSKSLIDTAGMGVLRNWIDSLATNSGNNTAVGGNFSDAHQALLFVNKTDRFTNTESAPITISITDFSFFATKKGNPVTPFIATVSANDSFTIKAIGNTRTAIEYQIGENHFSFSTTGQNTMTLALGETIVTGFMDCLSSGSGWGSSSVIPASTTGGLAEDDVWGLLPNPLISANTIYNASINTPAIVVGQTILFTNAGKVLTVYPSLRRTYKFAVSYVLGVQPLPIVVGSTGTNLIANGSFESGVTGWTTTGNLTIESSAPWSATSGNNLVAFNGGEALPNGALSQTFITTVGQSYTLAFDAGVVAYNTNAQTMQVSLSGAGSLFSQSITLSGLGGGTNRWLPQSFTFVADSVTTTLTFRDLSTFTKSIDLMLDNIRVIDPVSLLNTAPIAVADIYSSTQNTTLAVPFPGVLVNDMDAQANSLTTVIDSIATHGNVILNSNGSFSYVPNTGYIGPDSFTYHANDGSLDSNIVTVSIVVNAAVSAALVNGSFESGFTGWTISGNQIIKSAAPYAATDGTKLVVFNNGNTTPNAILSQSFATAVGQTYILAFDAGVLSYNTNSQTMLVTVTGTNDLLSQTLIINGLGSGLNRWSSQSFTFLANSTTSTLTFRDLSTTTEVLDLLLDNVQITKLVPSQNTAPLAIVDSYTTTRDIALVVPSLTGVLANDTDAQSDPLTAIINLPPSHGNLIINSNGSFNYTPAIGYLGGDSFTYHANDGNLDSNIVTVTITVNPMISRGLINGSFEQDFTGWTNTGNLQVKSATPYSPTNGSKLVAFNNGNSTPNAVLTQTFPTAVGQTYNLTFDLGVLSYNINSQKLLVKVTGNGNLISQTITLSGLSGGTNRWLSQNFSFVANSVATTLTFMDQSTTTNGLDLILDNVRIIGPASLNSAPVVVADSYSTTMNTLLAVAGPGILVNDSDAQFDLLTVALDSAPSHGSITLNSEGGFNYTPDVSFTGLDSFTYHANDSRLNSDITTVNITVNTPTTAMVFNGGFEQDLSFWNTSNVVVVSTNPFEGTKALDLKSGYLEQSITALVPGDTYTIYMAYRSKTGVIGLLGDATVSINGIQIGEIHNGSPTEYVDCNGFSFVPAGTSTILRIQSLETGTVGLLVDAIHLEHARLPVPPVASVLKNGSFEDQTGLSGNNPHVCGLKLPGWLVTQENVDVIRVSAFSGWSAVEGAWVLDLSGHGPGGIAQTVNNLVPGKFYTLSFAYARHRYWDGDPILKAEVYANGLLVTTLTRDQSQKVPAWTRLFLQVPASQNGIITLEFRSISKLTGGSIILDDVTLQPTPQVLVTDPITPDSTVLQEVPNGSSSIVKTEVPSIGTLLLSGTPGSLVISMTAPEPGVYSLERSSDILTWEQVSQIHYEAQELVEFYEPQDSLYSEPTKNQLFYRIGLDTDTQPY